MCGKTDWVFEFVILSSSRRVKWTDRGQRHLTIISKELFSAALIRLIKVDGKYLYSRGLLDINVDEIA